MNGKKNRIFPLVILTLAVAVCLILVWRFQSPRSSEEMKDIALSIIYEDGHEEHYEIQTDEAYLKAAVEQVATIDGEETSFGYTLYSVNGETHNFNEGNLYWAIYVNGEFGQYSLDAQPIENGGMYTLAVESY